MSEESSFALFQGYACTVLLQLIMIGLKVTGQLKWEWWMILVPVWVPVVVIGSCLLIIMVVTLVRGSR